MKFPYQQCAIWLRNKAKELSSRGYKVEINETGTPISSIVIKASSEKYAAELVVWETGATSMIVVNLSTNDYDLDRSDVLLVSEQFESELGAFFGLVK